MNALLDCLARYRLCVFLWRLYHKGLHYLRVRRLGRPVRRNGFSAYTVVTAAYNAEKYLEDYFRTLTGQTLDFKKHIRLILADDGSTDDSAVIIKAWQQRFPQNITYLRQENSGQGAARNLGLSLVQTPWVTFIDADDFVDVNYFRRVDDFLRRRQSADPEKALKMIACNCIRFREDNCTYANIHTLRGHFRNKETVLDLREPGDFIQLSASTAFFAVDELRRNGLAFPFRRWPTFEDGYFVQRYLLEQNAGRIAFLRAPRYYYRKRADLSSTLNTSRAKKAYYLEQLREGYLGIIKEALEKKGGVPEHLRRALFYEMGWRVKELCNAPAPAALSKEELEEFIALSREIFIHLDAALILNRQADRVGLDEARRVGALAFFKNEEPPFVNIQAEAHDAVKNEICLIYHQANPGPERIFVDGAQTRPTFAKTAGTSFCGQSFCQTRILWIPLPAKAQSLALVLGGRSVKFSLGGRLLDGPLPLPEARACLAPRAKVPRLAQKYAGAWIFTDRDTHADDNAEHLYRYARKHAPEQKIFFALRPSSPDWARLKAEGFNLLAFGSLRHYLALLGCAKIISSHADNYIINYPRNISAHKRFVFLQHGVTHNDISAWLNPKKIDLLVTATKPEYDAIAGEGSPYRLCAKNVTLSGFPRHDALLAGDAREEKTILIMPTWRNAIAGAQRPGTGARIPNKGFMETRYATRWSAFLRSAGLRELAARHGFGITFSPHINVQPYLESLAPGSHIKVAAPARERFQTLFKKSSVLITDYSSVAFDMALLQKAILYYQFDRDEAFSGLNAYRGGYFDYVRDGFGPVALDEDTLLDNLEAVLRSDARPAPEYLERMADAFPFRDGKNCERVLRAVKNLDEPGYA